MFYHNVTVIAFAIAEDMWNQDFESIWYLNQITDLEPRAFLFYKEKRSALDGDDWELDYYDNCIVEICENGEIWWF